MPRSTLIGFLLALAMPFGSPGAAIAEDHPAPQETVALAQSSSVGVRRSGDHWDLGVRGPAGARYRIQIDGKPLPDIAANRYRAVHLSRGVHKIEIGTPIPRQMLIRETGKASPTLAPARLYTLSVPTPQVRRPAPTIKVAQGDVVHLEWTSVMPAEIHFHGYDIEGRVGPGVPLTMIFEANLAGRFGVETHGGGNHPPFAFIEVYPR